VKDYERNRVEYLPCSDLDEKDLCGEWPSIILGVSVLWLVYAGVPLGILWLLTLVVPCC
jgi:hypothetical protein